MIIGDEASIAQETGVRLIPIRKVHGTPHHWLDPWELEYYRHLIETVNSQLESMGVERLRARTQQGLEVKVHASLIAVMATNVN